MDRKRGLCVPIFDFVRHCVLGCSDVRVVIPGSGACSRKSSDRYVMELGNSEEVQPALPGDVQRICKEASEMFHVRLSVYRDLVPLLLR